ncbi:unnamed protein product [Musa acuminata subsp. burmannicoides]
MTTTAAVSVALPEVKLFDRWGFDGLEDTTCLFVCLFGCFLSGSSEDASRIGSAGVVRRQARVPLGTSRQLLNQCLYIGQTISKSFWSLDSYAIKKKDEIECVAKANR